MYDIILGIVQEKSEEFHLVAVRKYMDYKELPERGKLKLVAIVAESGEHAATALNCLAIVFNKEILSLL